MVKCLLCKITAKVYWQEMNQGNIAHKLMLTGSKLDKGASNAD
jgi:hypothetical protein